jgi:hypothetical protein
VALIVYHQDSGVIGDYFWGLNWLSHDTITYLPTPPSKVWSTVLNDWVYYYNPPHVVHNLDGSGNVQLLLSGTEIFSATVSGSGQWDTISSQNEYYYSVESGYPIDSPIQISPRAIGVVPGHQEFQQGFVYSGPYHQSSNFDLIFTPDSGSDGNWSPTLPSLFYAPTN